MSQTSTRCGADSTWEIHGSWSKAGELYPREQSARGQCRRRDLVATVRRRLLLLQDPDGFDNWEARRYEDQSRVRALIEEERLTLGLFTLAPAILMGDMSLGGLNRPVDWWVVSDCVSGGGGALRTRLKSFDG